MYAFKSGDDCRNKMKGISETYSKNFKFDEHKKYLDRGKHQEECEKSILRSVNYEMHLQKTEKNTQSN